MGHTERSLRSCIKAHCSLYLRYVDDTFAIVPDEQSALSLCTALNNAHPAPHFTHIFESDGILPFLDVKVIRSPEGIFSTSLYRKQTYSGVYLNLNSFSPVSYKVGLVRTLFYRVHRIFPLSTYSLNWNFSVMF